MNSEIATIEQHYEAGSEKRLWQAVILHAIEEWMSGPLKLRRQAEEYLFSEQSDFRLVCQSAGMDVRRLRAGLRKLKSQPRQEACLAA
jgi:hypothetical protein